ncbi:hypothetical protein ACI3QN_13920, partial [Propionibacterium freudenreichii]|uniref:hypothetical protein n=1 Tax=Propionibacterium freudenreichii TaxID=1744 RepID=UPI003852093C
SAGITSIGIDAPPHIQCHRKEVYDRILASGENTTPAASTAPAQAVRIWGQQLQKTANNLQNKKDNRQS